MIEEDQGWLPNAPLDMEYDNNRDHIASNLRIVIVTALNITS